MAISVVGHSNPDTDSVTSAIALATLLTSQGQEAQACMQSALADLNPESKVVLEKFGLEAPVEISDAGGKDIALVDFSDLAQGPANLADANVVAVVDHHKVGDLTTNSPILFRAEPVGCTGTVLNKMFKEAGVACVLVEWMSINTNAIEVFLNKVDKTFIMQIHLLGEPVTY